MSTSSNNCGSCWGFTDKFNVLFSSHMLFLPKYWSAGTFTDSWDCMRHLLYRRKSVLNVFRPVTWEGYLTDARDINSSWRLPFNRWVKSTNLSALIDFEGLHSCLETLRLNFCHFTFRSTQYVSHRTGIVQQFSRVVGLKVWRVTNRGRSGGDRNVELFVFNSDNGKFLLLRPKCNEHCFCVGYAGRYLVFSHWI